MAAREEETGLGAARVLDADEVQGVLSGAFYAPDPRGAGARARKNEPKPGALQGRSASLLYNGDLERLDRLVEELQGPRRSRRPTAAPSIRVALDQLDPRQGAAGSLRDSPEIYEVGRVAGPRRSGAGP